VNELTEKDRLILNDMGKKYGIRNYARLLRVAKRDRDVDLNNLKARQLVSVQASSHGSLTTLLHRAATGSANQKAKSPNEESENGAQSGNWIWMELQGVSDVLALPMGTTTLTTRMIALAPTMTNMALLLTRNLTLSLNLDRRRGLKIILHQGKALKQKEYPSDSGFIVHQLATKHLQQQLAPPLPGNMYLHQQPKEN
jgi:hypothetical protein